MASSTTPILRMRADWTPSGACTRGSTAHPRGAMRTECGGAATTSTTRNERDADVGTDMARRGGVVPGHVGRHDGRDDAAVAGPDAVALPPGRPRPAHRARGCRLLRRLDRVWNGRLSAERRAGARHTARGRDGRPDGRLPPAHCLE